MLVFSPMLVIKHHALLLYPHINKSCLLCLCFYLFSNILYAGELEYNLTDAINRGDLQQARELVSRGADVNKKQQPFQQTPIIIAPLRGLDFVRLLVANGADVNARDQDNTTALINACLYGDMEIVKYLVARGADIYAVNNDDMSVLDAAKLSKNQPLIDFIKSKYLTKNK